LTSINGSNLQESSGIGEKEFNAKIKMGVDFVGTTGIVISGDADGDFLVD
jgi:hypothetical protein